MSRQEAPPYREATAAPYLARPLFFVFTVLLFIVALAQLGGRVLVANLDRLEPAINELLVERGIALTGLSGSWRFFNPVVRISSGEVPGVRFGAAWAELDMLESLARNRVVLRNAQIDDVQLSLVQVESGEWELLGQREEAASFDWRSLLWHSDQLVAQASISFRGQGVPASDLFIESNFSNFGGRHRGFIKMKTPNGCETCGVTAQYSVEEAVLWFRERSGGAVLQANGFELQDSVALIAGLDYLHLGELDGRMRLQGSRFSGPVRLLDGDLQLVGGKPTTVSLLADGYALDDGSLARFQLQGLQLGSGGGELDVRDALLNWTIESGLLASVPALDVGGITAVVGNILPPAVPTGAWIRRLGMQGRFTDVLASWSQPRGLFFGGDFSNVEMNSYRGVPAVADLAGSFTAGPGYLQLRMLESSAVVGFPQLYREEKAYSSITGEILMFFGQDYFGLRGSNLEFAEERMTSRGGFSLVSTQPLTDNHITLAMASDAGEFADLSPYVPYKLPTDVLDWLEQSGLEAQLSAPRFILHGPLREEESDMNRSYLLEADMRSGTLQFNPEWPRITDADGLVRVSHTGVLALLERAEVANLALADMRIALPSNENRVIANGVARFDAGAGLAFVRETPLIASMDFVAPDWWGDGEMLLNVDMDVPLDPLDRGELDPRVRVQIDGRLNGATLGMPEAGLEFADLRGGLAYRYPYELSGERLQGTLFGEPMSLAISSAAVAGAPAGVPQRFAPRRIDFEVASTLDAANLWPLLNMQPSRVVDGQFDFAAIYSTQTASDVPPQLSAETELLGAAVNLPAPFGKTADDRQLTVVSVEFGGDEQRANLLYGGILHADFGVADEGIAGGRLQLHSGHEEKVRLADWDGSSGPIVIDGTVTTASVADWVAGSEAGIDLPPYRIEQLAIGEVLVGDYAIADLELSGVSDTRDLTLVFSSPTAAGTLFIPETDTTELELTQFTYISDPAEEAPARELAGGAEAADAAASVDPLDAETMDSLQDMRVKVLALVVDDEDYGSWEFAIERTDDGIAFNELAANLKGVTIESVDGVHWQRESNRTAFKGTLSAGDMGDVLLAWGYARSLESASMATNVDVSWPGSPLNFELLQLRGDIAAGVRSGRFLDVANGNNALRIFSLLNFTAIAKRMSLNFKDVFGPGISFEKVEALTTLDEGLLSFNQPMRVEGTGGDFKFNGTINLVSGELDNEMVVTLPVNKSLPWLGAYLALANPVVGIGVLVGERILRKPIKELSSAKYSVTGNLDDPKLELVNVFDRTMSEGGSVPAGQAEFDDDEATEITEDKTDLETAAKSAD